METSRYMKNMIYGYMNICRRVISDNNAKIHKLEADIADEPSDQPFKDRCRRKIKAMEEQSEHIRNFIDYIMKYEIDGIPVRRITKYTVKSIILAYYYMGEKKVYPIPELFNNTTKRETAFKMLESEYGFSWKTFRNHWAPIIYKNKELRTPERIKSAIKVIATFDYPDIKEIIELAKQELKEAELKR